MIKTLDQTSIKALRAAITEALAKVGEAHGVHCSLSGASSYDPFARNASFKIAILLPNDSGDLLPPEAQELDHAAEIYGLPKDVRGKTVRVGNKYYEIIGMKSSSRKYPILGRDTANRKIYKLRLGDIQRALSLKVTDFSHFYAGMSGGRET